MGTSATVTVGHYIEVDNKVISNLYDIDELEDEFISHEYVENVISSNGCDDISNWDKSDNDFVKEITIDEINNSHLKFLANMRLVIGYLEDNKIEFKVKFGAMAVTH